LGQVEVGDVGLDVLKPIRAVTVGRDRGGVSDPFEGADAGIVARDGVIALQQADQTQDLPAVNADFQEVHGFETVNQKAPHDMERVLPEAALFVAEIATVLLEMGGQMLIEVCHAGMVEFCRILKARLECEVMQISGAGASSRLES
jgi:hypothetical protein